MLKNITNEIYLQLTDTPSFVKETCETIPKSKPLLEKMSAQLERLLEDPTKKLIFIVGPHGEGKTTFINYFLEKNPERYAVYKSFIKIRDLDFAYLHLTSVTGRFFFILLSLLLTYLLVSVLPATGALPILLALGYFFAKNAANLMYVFYGTFQNLIIPQEKFLFIEDLERSSLSTNDQWALISNLWQNKHRHIISIGYPPDQKQEKLKIFEYIMKLKGSVIEWYVANELKLHIAKVKFPELPFVKIPEKDDGSPQWLSLFTPQELLILGEEVDLKSKEKKTLDKQLSYITLCLELLTRKLELKKDEVFFDAKRREIRTLCIDSLGQEKRYYLESFVETINPSLDVTFNESNCSSS